MHRHLHPVSGTAAEKALAEGGCTLACDGVKVMNEIKKDELLPLLRLKKLRLSFGSISAKSYTPQQMQDTIIIRKLEKNGSE